MVQLTTILIMVPMAIQVWMIVFNTMRRYLISESYCDPKDYIGRYYGSHLGDKESGINVKYASDPYWGEKAASFYYRLDEGGY